MAAINKRGQSDKYVLSLQKKNAKFGKIAINYSTWSPFRLIHLIQRFSLTCLKNTVSAGLQIGLCGGVNLLIPLKFLPGD